MPPLRLAQREARIVYLATVYHLGRPGSETDPDTLERHSHGLASVHEVLDGALDAPALELELTDYQLSRLGEALLGTVNELKQFEMAQGRSAVPRFSETMARLFPDDEQADSALELVAEVMLLRRRLDGAVRAAGDALVTARERQAEAQQAASRPWWKIWSR